MSDKATPDYTAAFNSRKHLPKKQLLKAPIGSVLTVMWKNAPDSTVILLCKADRTPGDVCLYTTSLKGLPNWYVDSTQVVSIDGQLQIENGEVKTVASDPVTKGPTSKQKVQTPVKRERKTDKQKVLAAYPEAVRVETVGKDNKPLWVIRVRGYEVGASSHSSAQAWRVAQIRLSHRMVTIPGASK